MGLALPPSRANREGQQEGQHMNFPEMSGARTTSHSQVMTAARLDDLRAQALHARQRYELYKAKAYSQRLTSPTRLRELERASARAHEALRSAEAEAKRAGAPAPNRRS
jgi:hypothetical protein